MIKWLLNRTDHNYKKSLILWLLDIVLNSKTSSIDNKTAEKIITQVIKSKGNKITSFILKD